MGFNDKTSSIIVRVIRMVTAESAAPSTAAGTSICFRLPQGSSEKAM